MHAANIRQIFVNGKTAEKYYNKIIDISLNNISNNSNLNILTNGNRIQVDNYTGLTRFTVVAEIINRLKNSPYKNIVIDDFNYLAQDFYMANAMKGGWDTPKQIGYGMGLIFNAIKGMPENKNIICCAHYEEYKDRT